MTLQNVIDTVTLGMKGQIEQIALRYSIIWCVFCQYILSSSYSMHTENSAVFQK